jgi:hypothetical protein
MKFKEASNAAGLRNPGRTTWCGVASHGTAVFTMWAHDVGLRVLQRGLLIRAVCHAIC